MSLHTPPDALATLQDDEVFPPPLAQPPRDRETAEPGAYDGQAHAPPDPGSSFRESSLDGHPALLLQSVTVIGPDYTGTELAFPR